MDDTKARLLDLNHVSFLHSQSIYHAVAYCTKEASVGTIILLTPREPYVSIGYHQALAKDVDNGYCRKKGIPVVRREVGGGTVYLDRDQLFFQCVFPKERAPHRVDHLYALFLKPAVNTYRRLGVDARYRPVNDIQVGEKKICGTGGGRIGEASVVVGNILYDFNYREMSRILRAPSETFRVKVHDSMQLYMTTLRRELGYIPDRERVKRILIEEFEELLGNPLSSGDLTPEEHRMRAEIDKRFTDPRWLYEKGGRVNHWVKISANVVVAESVYNSPGGRVSIILRLKDDLIDDIFISGDVTFQPREDLEELEGHLVGKPLEAGALRETIDCFYAMKETQSSGVGPEDLVKALMLTKN